MKPITERVAYQSVKGRRPSNQDAVVVGVMADGREVTAVADGMGGRLAGDVASRRALETLIQRIGAGDELESAIEEANLQVYRESQTNEDFHGMGTTIVALLQTDDAYLLANVGDSRAYRLAADGISRMTADHSFTAEAVGRGEMTQADAEATPWANALTRAVGTEDTVEVDVFGPFDATESHLVLLCSDGFYKPLTDEGVLSSVLGCDPEEDMAASLVDVALRAGSDDNVTVAVVSFGDDSWVAEAVKLMNADGDSEDAPTVEFVRFSGAGSDVPTDSGSRGSRFDPRTNGTELPDEEIPGIDALESDADAAAEIHVDDSGPVEGSVDTLGVDEPSVDGPSVDALGSPVSDDEGSDDEGSVDKAEVEAGADGGEVDDTASVSSDENVEPSGDADLSEEAELPVGAELPEDDEVSAEVDGSEDGVLGEGLDPAVEGEDLREPEWVKPEPTPASDDQVQPDVAAAGLLDEGLGHKHADQPENADQAPNTDQPENADQEDPAVFLGVKPLTPAEITSATATSGEGPSAEVVGNAGDGFRIVMPPPRPTHRRKRSGWVRIPAFLIGVVAIVFALMRFL